ncbi:MAG: ATP-dependent RecD-like DNA helicase [Lachnospiraceae bacterium]|nr:ATP-dependent RecD-like DNA helicase [Lachnospiraceae bacterium]
MEEIKGYVAHIIYRNEENAYTVFELDYGKGSVTCTGFPLAISEGESCRVEGEMTQHPVYGDQLRIGTYQAIEPETTQAMFRYLSSGAIKGIGESLARRILKKFGEDTMRILDEEPERLAEIRGISPRKAREIAAQAEGKRDQRDAMVFLQQYGIGGQHALRIWKTYGMKLYEIIRENPYRLADDIRGIGFATADEIAFRVGIRADSDFRIRSGILYILSQVLQEGSTWMERSMVIRRTADLLSLSEEQIDLQLDNLAMDRKLMIRNREGTAQVYSMGAYRREQQIARALLELDAAPLSVSGDMTTEERIRRIEEREGIELDDLQRQAVLLAADHAILLISGGPGTDKTTTINTIINYFEEEDMEVLLCAPTGRAAKRMKETTGMEAMTIHRMLGVRARDGEEDRNAPAAPLLTDFGRDEENPLEADVIIVDEMSMVDMYLFHALLKAVRSGTRLILVGDVNQLPSVGPGRILQDLIRSGAFRTVILQKIFRQAARSDIVVNAHRILRGEMPSLGNKSRDFFFLERDSLPVIYKNTVQLIREMLPGYVKCSPDEIQVLTPMRKGNLGVERLNQVLQSVLNPPAPDKREYVREEVTFREGDKVMQTRNNYQIEWQVRGNFGLPLEKGTGIFNGDFGRILSVDPSREILTVRFDEDREVDYPFGELEDLELAYAVTVHKSQGSEYPAVILPLLSGPRGLFNRNLLYTAVTRARSCVVILGSREAVRTMTDNVRENIRNTGLEERIHELCFTENE